MFVLDIVKAEDTQYTKESYSSLSGQMAIVRRPKQGTDGVWHMVDRFHLEELETQEDRHTRQLSEMEEMKMRFSPNATQPSQGELFTTN